MSSSPASAGAPVDVARPRGWSEPGRTTLEIKTGGWRTRRPLWVEATAPCRAACPAGEPIAGWIERARQRDWAGAWRLLREENPFPAVTGRVCGHPCEGACNRIALDGAVAINALERFVGDWGLAHGGVEPPAVRRRERVAVVGGGPAGLAGAYHLARLGYRVTIFEREEELGGLLRYGIPEYRLPRAVLEREIGLVLALGVEVRTGRHLAAPDYGRELGPYDAVFVATGAAVPLALHVPGETARNVRDGLAFLHALSDGSPPALGARVLVIGGGSTAMDVARSARRLGAGAVTVAALEAREAMPALPDEVDQALAEGVEIRNEIGVPWFGVAGDLATGALLSPARLRRAPDGSIQPVFEGDAVGVLEVDDVLLAIGQRADLDALGPGLRTEGGVIAIDARGATSRPRLFAGGDVASRQRTVAHAIGAGARAARAIHARLTGGVAGLAGLTPPWAAPRPEHVVAPSAIALDRFARAPRLTRWQRPPGERGQGFAEVVAGVSERDAGAEALRCFTCGHCTACDTCVAVCPDMAIARADGGYRLSLDHCKGCGLCVAECPRGALRMVADR